MSKATLPTQEQKVRHKMYKTHKGWMVAGMATVSMALPMVVMTTKASADSVPVPTNSSVNTPTTDSTAVTTATGTAQNGNGQNVEVPHQNLDNAVNQANQTGVKVTQNQTTSQTVTADQSQQAQANITNDYNQQTQKVNEATKAQDWKNTTYKNDQADANQVNANNQAKINQAVQNASQEGVNVYHDTTNDVTQTANIGRYDNSDYEAKKQDANQKTDETVAKLNEVTAKAHANNTVANASNDHSTLDQTVQDARSNGFTVNQEATRNVGEVTTANADQLANSIRQDYQNQNDELTLAISQYYAKAQQNLGTTDVEGFLHSLWEARRSYAVNHGNVDMTGSGSWTNFAIDDYDGMAITPHGAVHSLSDLKNGNFQVIVEHATPSKVVEYVEWGNVAPQLISGELNAGLGQDNQGDYDKYPEQKDNGTRTQTWNVTPGTKFRIPGAVHMANGDVKDLIVTVRQSGNKLNGNHITIYNQDGAVNFSNVGNGYNNDNRIDLEFWINNEDDHTDYLWVTTIADIDVKQKFSYGSTQIIGLGGLVSVHDGVIQGSDGTDLNGPSSAPNGMAILALHENHFWVALQDDGGSAYYPMIAVFGKSGNVEPTVIPDKPTLAYHYDTFSPRTIRPSDSIYTTANLAVNTPTPETANYTLHNLTVTTQAEKGATQVNDNSDVIADGHKLLAGDALTYNIDVKDNSLPANRADDTTSFTFTDTLPSAFTLDSYSISNGNDGGDVTQLFNYIYDPATRKFTATAKKPLLDLMNKDKTKAYFLPSLHLNGRVNASGATLRNQADVLINGVKASTNVVTNTSTNSNPSKAVSVDGQDANGKTTITNDMQSFDVTFDLKDYANTTASDAIKSRGIKFTDDMTITNNAVSLNQESIKLVDAHGNTVSGYTLNVNPTNNGYQLVVNINNAKDFLNTYGGQELHLQYTAKTNDGVTGSVKNVATENIYGSTYTTNTVITNVKDINPTKDVVVNAGENVSINGETVDYNSNINYKLNSSELPANRATVVTNWSTTDGIDTKHVKPTGNWHVYTNTDFVDNQGNTIKAKTDISRYFNYNYNDKTGVVTVTPTNEYLQIMNNASNVKTAQSWSAYVQTKVIGSGWTYNSFDENLNNDLDHSNQVKTFSYEPVVPKPNKDATIGQNVSNNPVSINGKGVTKGDTISYELKGQALPQYHDTINTFSTFDVFDTGIQYIGFKAFMDMPDGTRKDVSNMIKADVDGNTVAFVANNELINLMNSDKYNTKASATPTIYAFAKVTADGIKEINNSYFLNINSKQDVSNIVTNKTVTSDPDKKETVAGIDSNGKTVIANDHIDYKVTWDLSQLDPNKIAVSDEQMDKGLGFEDILQSDKPNTFQKGPVAVKVTDTKGNVVNVGIWLNDSDDGSSKRFESDISNPREFLKQYGGQKLTITYSIPVQDGVNAHISNTFIQKNFGNIYTAPVVKNTIKDINPTKDIVVNAGENHSINGDTVPLNSTYNYKLNSSELPADRATVVTNWATYDRVDTNHVSLTGNWQVQNNKDFVDANGKAIKAGSNISNYFTYQTDKDGSVRITPKAEFLSIMNQANNKETAQSWSAYVQVKVIKAGWVTNTFNENLNDGHDKSNEVKTFSFDPVTPDPKKDVALGETTAPNAQSINGSLVAPGDNLTYELKGQPLPQYHEQIKSFSATDVFDKGVTYNGFKAFLNVTDANGKVTQIDVTDYLKEQKSDNSVVWTATEQLLELLNSDAYNTKASVTPTIYAKVTVDKDKAETIDNAYFVNINNKQSQSNIVENTSTTPAPTKGDYDTDGNNIDGKNVLAQSQNEYQLNWNNAKYKGVVASDNAIKKGFYYVDDVQDDALDIVDGSFVVTDEQGNVVKGVSAHVYDSISDVPRDVSDMLKANKLTPQGKFVVYSADDPQAFFKDYVQKGVNLKLSFKVSSKVDFNGEYKNKAYQVNFGQAYETNEVTNKVIKTTPTKEVKNGLGEDINGKTIARGDVLGYEVGLDLTDFVNYSLTKDQLAKGLSISDDYDETKLNITDANKAGFIVLDKDGKAVDKAMFTLTWNNEKGAWTLSVKDPQMFLKQYGGQKLAILFFTTAKKDVTGDIYNKAIQNSFGQIVETNTVVNHIPEMNPHKDAVVSVDKQGSLDSHEIALGDTFNYKLDSSIRPANYGGITSEWSYIDKLDTEHDQYQGQFKVYAKRDFQLADGSLIKAGSDISKFFTATYDTQTGEFKVTANQDFLAIMNLDVNKATEQGWVAYVNVKRIKSGEVHNTAEESYNHEVLKTNTVITTTPEPPASKQPVAPQVPTMPKEIPKEIPKETPKVAQAVPTNYQAPTVKTPTPVANETVLPQTGQSDDTILAILGITLGTIGTMTLAGAKKKRVKEN